MMDREELLREIKTRLSAAYGERLKGVVLYGSEARGEAREDSDYDFLVLLEGPVNFAKELRFIISIIFPIEHEIICNSEPPQDRLLDVLPVDAKVFEAGEYDLYFNAKREGIFL